MLLVSLRETGSLALLKVGVASKGQAIEALHCTGSLVTHTHTSTTFLQYSYPEFPPESSGEHGSRPLSLVRWLLLRVVRSASRTSVCVCEVWV